MNQDAILEIQQQGINAKRLGSKDSKYHIGVKRIGSNEFNSAEGAENSKSLSSSRMLDNIGKKVETEVVKERARFAAQQATCQLSLQVVLLSG